jgi:anti-sigma factor RsiW
MKVVPLDTDMHHAVQALLPWYLTQRLDSDDVARVEAHLANCPSCQAELELERRLQAAQPLSSERGDVERGLARMRELIRPSPPRWRPARTPALRWLLGAQFAVIALLATLLVLPRAGGDAYRALGAPAAAAAANAVVMFKPDATEQQIRAALRNSGARMVDGPTASNAYLLSVPSQGHAAAIARLRAQPAVSLAESLDARPAP